jgi:hypothetical protein
MAGGVSAANEATAMKPVTKAVRRGFIEVTKLTETGAGRQRGLLDVLPRFLTVFRPDLFSGLVVEGRV